ncbi:MAG: sigma-70 family RNA polymerase sigma factor [Chloroflexaceae bacterium]|nr:sigma-70 family RNA polymerase sigma factor [Chloroflexaceae bacterium]
MSGLQIDLQVYDAESDLLEGLRRGDHDACTCLVKRFAPLVYAHALRMLQDSDEAESILQLTFIKACQKIGAFEGRSGLGTWLYRIATNEALMQLRKRSSSDVTLDHQMADTIQADDLPRNTSNWSLDPATAALGSELREQLETALATLPDNLRLVFVLRELQSLSTEETASALGISQSAVKVRLHRARLRLRELLADYITRREEDD